MTTAPLATVDVAAEVEAIQAALVARADPSYERGMRRTVPSEQPAHAVRIPEVRRTAREWSAAHRSLPAKDVLAVCDALWATAWREERIVAGQLLERKPVLHQVDWARIGRWSHDIDNWEHVDNLAAVTGRMLLARPELIEDVLALSRSDHPGQRRLSLVTLIVAGRDARWLPELRELADKLKGDAHPLVRKAVVWARRELTQRGGAIA